mmetsp:Transcript_40598/g.84975  ORF Transcript_40598/g.84975 Transcript_40598/m.84975 type:complete len:305 (-) Transcript_40598:177-1091(-)
MNNILRKISLDKAALGIVSVAAITVLGEAACRTSLGDAQNANECRYPPLSSIVTEEHVRELEEKSVVVIHNILSKSTLHNARRNVEALRVNMNASLNDEDVRQDQILSIRENDNNDNDNDNDDHHHQQQQQQHGDALIHCIKLLRGIPFLLDRFGYATSHSHVIPRQCQLAMYKPDGKSIYVRHLDRCNLSLGEMGLVGWLRASDYRHRVVTAILYLNTPLLDGGELRLFDDDDDDDDNDNSAGDDDDERRQKQQQQQQQKHCDIVPSGGKLILFDSSRIEHQVLASRGDDRYALTCWFNGDLA